MVSSQDSGPKAAPRRILYVDDEPDVLDSLQDILERSLRGVQVVLAPSGDAAVPLLEGASFDLVISDFRMQGMDGIEFLHEVQERMPDVPRVLYTAYADDALEVRARREAGVVDVLSKDLDPRALVEKVCGYLGTHVASLRRP